MNGQITPTNTSKAEDFLGLRLDKRRRKSLAVFAYEM